MAIGVETVVASRCPEEAHAGFLVWRDGFHGKVPARRQRFRCVNPQDSTDWHRFTPPVLRAEAHEHRCLDCQQYVPAHAGPVVPSVDAFTLLFAYGYDVYEGPQEKPPEMDPADEQARDDGALFGGDPVAADRAVNGRLLRIGLAVEENEASWKAFLSDWSGTPQVAVGDGANGARNAVEALWPGRVLWVRCAYHWKKNLVSAVISDLVRLTGLPSESAKAQKDRLVVQARAVFTSTAAFLQFQTSARKRFGRHAEFAELPASSLVWLQTNSKAALAQLAEADTRPGPQSIGPLEQVIFRTRQQVAGRAQSLRNPVRTQRMLTLLAAGSRYDANVDIWAGLIYAHLAANHSRPALRQREVTGHTMSELAIPQPKPVVLRARTKSSPR